MVRLLPFILIPILLVAGVGFWSIFSDKKDTTSSNLSTSSKNPLANLPFITQQPVEVPKTLPEASSEEKIKTLQEAIEKLASEINSLKSNSNTIGSKVDTLESSDTDLKARVSALEKATPAPAAASSESKSTVYIPLGSGSGPWANQGWYTVTDYQVNLDPGNFPGYTGMYLEVTFRLTEAAGTGSVRLYNTTDSSAISSQVDTTSSSFGLLTTSSFKLTSGSKNYALQVKSSEGKNLFIQTARIRVNF